MSYIVAYPNQKIITVKRITIGKTDQSRFLKIRLDSLFHAMMILGDGAFRLYLYLMANKDGYTLALSQADVEDNIGLKEGRYRKAVQELQEKYYLKPIRERTNRYTIYEWPCITTDDIRRRDEASGADNLLVEAQEPTGQTEEKHGLNNAKDDTEIRINRLNNNNDTIAGNNIKNDTIADKTEYNISGGDNYGLRSDFFAALDWMESRSIQGNRSPSPPGAFEDLSDDDGELPF